MAKGGFAVDVSPNGFGLIELAYHACAVHSSPITDNLYLVLDFNDEPVDDLLPLPSTAPEGTDAANIIFQFDGDEDSSMCFRWRGKLNLMPFPVLLQYCLVQAAEFSNLVMHVYANGVLLHSRLMTAADLFRLKGKKAFDSYEFEFVGTSRVRSVRAAESSDEVVVEGVG